MAQRVNASGWSLILSTADWEDYRRRVAMSLDTTVSSLEWGAPPAIMPCLVASVAPNGVRVLSSYVFPEDAGMLLQAHVDSHVVPDLRQSIAEQEKKAKAGGPTAVGVPSVQAEHNKSMSAHVLAIVDFLIEKAVITNQAEYESRYHQMLTKVDQEAAKDRDDTLNPEEGK